MENFSNKLNKYEKEIQDYIRKKYKPINCECGKKISRDSYFPKHLQTNYHKKRVIEKS